MATGPRGSDLTTSITSTTISKTLLVVLKTFDTFTDPVAWLHSQLASRLLADLDAPSTAILLANLLSYSILGDGRRDYRWTVTVTWTV